MTTLTDEQIDAVFDYFDLSNDGKLSKHELKTALQILKVDLTDEEISGYDDDQDAFYDKEEFKQVYLERFQGINCRARIAESMSEFDPEGTGIIQRDTLIDILTQKGDNPMSEEEIADVLEDLDTNKDGRFEVQALIELLYPEEEPQETSEEPPAEQEEA